ncbi:MAG: hypothetical protein WDW36_006240 [Sanguina aurantia]
MREVLELLISKKDLTQKQAEETLMALLDDFVPEQASAFLVLLRAKGETAGEIAGLAQAMLERGLSVHCAHPVVDIVGTGGDGIGSVNISTGAAILAAAAGAKVAKHGNRSVSSLCGSADVLEALGVAIDLGPDDVARCVNEAGIGFMYAPRYHPAMKAVRPIRAALKVRTALNMLGPLLNPAHAAYGLVGVYDTSISELMAGSLLRQPSCGVARTVSHRRGRHGAVSAPALTELRLFRPFHPSCAQAMGVRKALVVHSMGLDEMTPMGPADVVEVVAGQPLRRYSCDPRDLGILRCTVEDLKGGDAALNAAILRDVFGGQQGPVADALVLNAAYALAACSVASSPAEGVAMAREVQRSGAALTTLDSWAALTQRLAAAAAPQQ